MSVKPAFSISCLHSKSPLCIFPQCIQLLYYHLLHITFTCCTLSCNISPAMFSPAISCTCYICTGSISTCYILTCYSATICHVCQGQRTGSDAHIGASCTKLVHESQITGNALLSRIPICTPALRYVVARRLHQPSSLAYTSEYHKHLCCSCR